MSPPYWWTIYSAIYAYTHINQIAPFPHTSSLSFSYGIQLFLCLLFFDFFFFFLGKGFKYWLVAFLIWKLIWCSIYLFLMLFYTYLFYPNLKISPINLTSSSYCPNNGSGTHLVLLMLHALCNQIRIMKHINSSYFSSAYRSECDDSARIPNSWCLQLQHHQDSHKLGQNFFLH